MKPGVIGQLGMKGSGHQFALLYRYRSSVGQLSQHFYIITYSNDNRGTNKDSVKGRRVKRGDFQVLLEAIDLASEGVALNPDVHQLKGYRVLLGDLMGHHYHAGAGAPNGFSLVGHLRYRLPEMIDAQQSAQGSAFAAGDNKPVDLLQMLRKPHLAAFYTQSLEYSNVFYKVSL
jgi:hypothetical protein